MPQVPMLWPWISTLVLLAAGAASLYLAAAAVLVGRFAARRVPPAPESPSVSILKPLHGDEPELAENLASFCAQDYPGLVQIVFGVQEPGDPAARVARELIERFPEKDLELVVDPRRHGTNGKVSNLINMAERIRHDVVVVADSDMRVGPDYLVRVVGALRRPGVGGVTCLYHGLPMGGLWSRLSALAIDSHFLPNVVMGVGLGLARPCFGSTVALGRETLAEVGGFTAFADDLADDYAIGAAVQGTGRTIAIPPFTIGHACAERSLAELWRHEVRWARTIRSVDPVGHAASVLTHALPLALLGIILGGGAAGLVTAAAAFACRTALCVRGERAFGLGAHPYWLIPLRDLLSFAVFAWSLFGGGVSWKGYQYRVAPDGAMIPDRRSTP